ncbi:hypothetical protein Bca52824_053035 [Brassica carinata]|uniref:Uncharacterized protein n=1 Tax=Brassica carinata TaxID=52824 RepID=A0A8X7R7A8_BRACI|nr:hypothetical protein Bca52824_053035 [Brassica carinata]
MPFLACPRLPDQVGLAPSCLFKSRGDLLFCGFIPRLSRVDEDPTAFGSSHLNLLVTWFLRCFLVVLGGGGLAVVWPRAFTLNSCHRFYKS